MPAPEIVILGAGPAGATAALLCARRGLSTVLVDDGTPRANRIETLPPTGRALAQDLGLQAALDAAGLGRVSAIRLDWRALPETRHPTAQEAPDLLDRATFRQALLDLALAEGATLLHGRARLSAKPRLTVMVLGAGITPRIVIDARGRAALPRKARTPLVALPFSLQLAGPLSGPEMHVTSHSDGWSWRATLASGRSEGALFLAPARLSGLSPQDRRALLVAQLSLPAETLRLGQPCPAGLHAAPYATGIGPVLRIGDAALARDPISSHGLVHALRSAAHAVAAAATLLTGEESAPLAFLEQRHSAALRQATEATARAYAEMRGEAPPPPRPPRAAMPPLGRPLCLNAALRDAPVLTDNRIHWAKAIHLPASAEDAAAFGPVDAVTVARLLAPPAPVTELARRLDAALPAGLGRAILTRLIDEGALVADQTATRSSTA